VTRRHVVGTIMMIGGEKTNNLYVRGRVIGKGEAKLTLVEPVQEEISICGLKQECYDKEEVPLRSKGKGRPLELQSQKEKSSCPTSLS
jgi:hypothetical protein